MRSERRMQALAQAGLILVVASCSTAVKNTSVSKAQPVQQSHGAIAARVLEEGIGQKDTSVIHQLVAPDYIQHSTLAADGRDGLLEFVANSPKIGVEIHRVFEDGDKVALHVTYTFPDDKVMIAFDVFRVENGQLVEHWDVLQAEVPASETASGRSMTDGPTEVVDRDKTEQNRQLVVGFVDSVLTNGQFDRLLEFIDPNQYDQHNPAAGDGIEGLNTFVEYLKSQNLAFGYVGTPLVIASGNFVLTGSEGFFGPPEEKRFAIFYDLFRVDNGKIVEHWDVILNPAPDPSDLPHPNGLF